MTISFRSAARLKTRVCLLRRKKGIIYTKGPLPAETSDRDNRAGSVADNDDFVYDDARDAGRSNVAVDTSFDCIHP